MCPVSVSASTHKRTGAQTESKIMAEAILKKRPMDIEEEDTSPPEKVTKKMLDEEDSTLADLEYLTIFSGVLINATDKKKSVTESDFTNKTPRVRAINRPEDDRTQTLAGFHLTDGEDSYILPIDVLRKQEKRRVLPDVFPMRRT